MMRRASPRQGVRIGAVALLVALVVGVIAGEWLGWPFLARPVEALLSDTLQRRVSLSPGVAAPEVSADVPAKTPIDSARII